MLRRRTKGTAPRIQRHETPQPQETRSRRRARPGAEVPAELLVKPEHLAPPRAKPAKGKGAALPPAPSQGRGRTSVILVTGFEPFDGEKTNPSWEICSRLPAAIAGMRVETCRVPCEFRRSIEVVAEAIHRTRPTIVVSIGQAGGRTHVSLERVAINVDDARIPDNAGARPVDEPVASQGPPAYFATLPIKAMAAAMRRAGVPAQVSNTAGTYVCNHLMYGVLHVLASEGGAARAGFIHVPYAEEQALDKPGVASMALATMVKGIEAAIAAAVENGADIRTAEGSEQ